MSMNLSKLLANLEESIQCIIIILLVLIIIIILTIIIIITNGRNEHLTRGSWRGFDSNQFPPNFSPFNKIHKFIVHNACMLMHSMQDNVGYTSMNPIQCPGEPVFSVMAANCFSEKSGWIGKVEDVKLVLFFLIDRISTGNHFEEEDFTRMNYETCKFHPVWFI